MTFVTSYANPDLDGLACTLGYAHLCEELGDVIIPAIFGAIDSETKFALRKTSINLPPKTRITNRDSVILVDASKVTSLPFGINPEQVIIIIDHRKGSETEKFPRAKAQIELVGAAATLIVEKYQSASIPIPSGIAVLLYGAIASNTLRFRAKVTTDRDKQAAELLRGGHTFDDGFIDKMFKSKSNVSGPRLRQRLAGDRFIALNHRKRISILQLEILGARNVATTRTEEICQTLNALESEEPTDLSFASFIDLGDEGTVFVTPDQYAQSVLEAIFSVKFKNNLAELDSYVMRKEIGPKLTDYFKHE